MANPNWQKNGTSPNPAGRPKIKHGVRTIKGMVERFIKRNITPNKLQAMYDGLKPIEKLNFLTELMPYVQPKLSAVGIQARIEGADKEAIAEIVRCLKGGANDEESILAEILNEPRQLPPIKQAI